MGKKDLPVEETTQKIKKWASPVYRDTLSTQPAINQLPDWWKDQPLYQISNDPRDLGVINNNGKDAARISFKHCMPFFDAITAGYHYLLPIDITVSIVNGSPELSWKNGAIRPVDIRHQKELPIPPGCWDTHYLWEMRWGHTTPPGYSLLFTHPINRFDLPFITTSGIQDNDTWGAPNAIAFFLKKDFEGVIPAGTPLFSMIPIKREPWEIEEDQTLEPEGMWDLERKRRFIAGYYKYERWHRKSYR